MQRQKNQITFKDSAKPCIQPIRPIPFLLCKKFDAEVDKMIKAGVFEEHKGPTEWLSNPVIVPKNDEAIRITVDYTNLNKSLLNVHYPIPRLDHLRDSMNGCKYFTNLT